ncbi:hypothetical protein DPMN_170832 [Dreissena polymorpha]|uniref:Uncharacterized protein n=1 Tax=Dreissena polymorpha TaxID=45954 RepID=A0A9D4E043_DREPO|nr:hypothetical protein DPMN_170832 [Dreissena polymorpha]
MKKYEELFKLLQDPGKCDRQTDRLTDRLTDRQSANHKSPPVKPNPRFIPNTLNAETDKHCFESAGIIVDRILREAADDRLPDASRPDYNKLISNCNKRRQRQRPKDPTDMNLKIFI